MELYKIILGISFVCTFFAELSTIPDRIKIKFDLDRLKPLDCSMCLSGWMSISYCIYSHLSLENSIFVIGSTIILSYGLTRIINL